MRSTTYVTGVLAWASNQHVKLRHCVRHHPCSAWRIVQSVAGWGVFLCTIDPMACTCLHTCYRYYLIHYTTLLYTTTSCTPVDRYTRKLTDPCKLSGEWAVDRMVSAILASTPPVRSQTSVKFVFIYTSFVYTSFRLFDAHILSR